MYKNVWPYSRCVYIPVTGIPSSGTRATTLTPFGSCTVGEFTAIAGNTFNKLDCAEAGNLSEVQSMREAILAIRSPKAAQTFESSWLSPRVGSAPVPGTQLR